MIKIVKRIPIHKGWSPDKKYYGEDIEGQKYLIRISSIESYNRRLKEFELMKVINKTSILMSKPLDLGLMRKGFIPFNHGSMVLMLMLLFLN